MSKILLVLISFTLVSCATGPKIELCQIDGDPVRLSLDCAKKKRQYVRLARDSDGYICLSRNQAQAFFMACRDKEPVTVDFCNIGADDVTLYCGGLRDNNDFIYSLTWAESVGYVCTNVRDLRVYLDWCYR